MIATVDEARPYLPSAIALIGLTIILGVTAYMGVEYWAVRRDDPEMAWINAGCELIAFGGLAAAAYGWPKRWPWIIVGTLIALVMSAACGFTAYQRLADDDHERATNATRRTEEFRDAQKALREAREEARSWTTDDPRPTCKCPDTIAAWGETHGAEAERRERVIERRNEEMTALLPERVLSVAAMARAAGLELVKLLGFGAFGGVWFYAWRSRRETTPQAAGADVPRRTETQPRPEPAVRVVEQAAATRPKVVKAPRPPRTPPRPTRSRGTLDAADIGGWGRPVPLKVEG